MSPEMDVAETKLHNGAIKEDIKQDIKFENILEDIGNDGRYQTRLNILFNCVTVFITTTASYSPLLSVIVPNHWCHVPGRETSNVSVEEWKDITLPRDGDSYSKCFMYAEIGDKNETVPCQYGWEYDTTWVTLTAASQEDWVCEKKMYPSNALFFGVLFSIGFGMLYFYIGDRIGRRKQFILCLSTIAIFRLFMVVSSSIYPLFIAVIVLPTAAGTPCIESTLAIGLELSSVKQRSAVNFRVQLFYGIGTIAMALTAWLLKNWICFVLVSAVLCFIPLFFLMYLPESPRWLISKGRPNEALSVLQRIASFNGKQLPHDTFEKLNALAIKRSPKMGIKTIFTNRNLFRNTMLLVSGRVSAVVTMFTILFSSSISGNNPFIAYIAQGAVQVPAFTVAHIIGNTFGRRWTQCFTFLAAAITASLITCLITVSAPYWIITCGSVFLQFCTQTSVSITNLQSMEIHPTCIRQISMAIEYTVMSLSLSLTPYLGYLGAVYDPRYMFGVLTTITLFASVLVSFLPESMNETLPETVEDATLYGRDQRYWSLQIKKPLNTIKK